MKEIKNSERRPSNPYFKLVRVSPEIVLSKIKKFKKLILFFGTFLVQRMATPIENTTRELQQNASFKNLLRIFIGNPTIQGWPSYGL